MFKIIKKTAVLWHHQYNTQILHLSDFEVVSDNTAQTFILRSLNGSYYPRQAVSITDIVLIDETDASVEETFATIFELEQRLVELQYTPYQTTGGGGASTFTQLNDTPNTYTGQAGKVVTVNDDEDGLEFTDPTAGAVGTLQQVTDNGATTNNDILITDGTVYTSLSTALVEVSNGDNTASIEPEQMSVQDGVKRGTLLGGSLNLTRDLGTGKVAVIKTDNLEGLAEIEIVQGNGIMATREWVNLQGFITDVIADLGYNPENSANKATNLTSPDNTKYPTTLAVSEAFDPLIKRRYFDDLQGYGTGGVGSIFAGTGTLETEGNIWINRNGTGTTWARTPAEAGHSGIIRGGTGTTSSGLNLIQFRSIWIGTEDFICQTAVRIQNLSDATNRFTIGFSNGVGTVNSMRIFYSDNINGGKWQCETYSGSLSTLVDSGILVATNTWYDLKITRINMICYFYINNVLVATSSTNIPSNLESFCGTTISKTVGTTSRTCDFDYLKFFDL
jgi:hypothetical protein